MRYAVVNALGKITWHTSGGAHGPVPAIFDVKEQAEQLAEVMRRLNKQPLAMLEMGLTDGIYNVISTEEV